MPRTFTDAKGRTWDVTLSLGGALRIDRGDYSELTDRKFSFVQPDKEELLYLLTETRLLFAVIWALVQPQAEKLIGISDQDKAQEDFLDGIDGATINAARDAFAESCANFFQEQRTALSIWMKQMRKGAQLVNAELEAMEGQVESLIREEISQQAAALKEKLQTMRTRAEPAGAT